MFPDQPPGAESPATGLRDRRIWRRVGIAVLVAAAFYGGLRAGMVVGALQALDGQIEQSNPGLTDTYRALRHLPAMHRDLRVALDARCPPAPVMVIPAVGRRPAARVARPQVRKETFPEMHR